MSEENCNQPIDNAAELQQRYAEGERNFRKANLMEANLQGANLQEANLQEAKLRGAFLKESDLKAANLSAADLQGANLNGAYLELTKLEKADLQGANLKGANLGGALLMGANLERADLTFADFSDTYMLAQGGSGGANLEGANLKGAELRGANLKGANLSGADLRGAKVKGAYPEGAYYDGQTHFPDGFDPVKLNMQKSSTSSKKSSGSALSLKPTFATVAVACVAVVISPVVLIKTWAEANKPKSILTAKSEMSITFEANKPIGADAKLKSGKPATEADVDAKLKSGRPATEADVDALLKSGKPATEADVDALLKGERAPLIPNPKANKLVAKLVDKVGVEANKPKSTSTPDVQKTTQAAPGAKSAGITPIPVAKVTSCPVLVRLINAASPDKPSAVDVSVNGKKVISNVPFSQASRYVSVSPGKLRVQIMQAGTMKMVGTRTFAAAPNSAYSVAVTGPLPGPRGKKLLFDKSPFVISENLSPPKPGKFKGRWYNLSETKEATDLRITKFGTPNVDAARLVKLIPKTTVDYPELQAGTYNFNPLLPNKAETLINSAYKPAIRVEIAKAKIPTGAIFDVFAIGNSLGRGLNSLKLSATSYKTLPRTAAGCVRVQ